MVCLDCQYENVRRISYDDALFVPVCMTCRRFVKADDTVRIRGDGHIDPNATCSKCGRTQMHFEGFHEQDR